jgi:hypothetical protein
MHLGQEFNGTAVAMLRFNAKPQSRKGAKKDFTGLLGSLRLCVFAPLR